MPKDILQGGPVQWGRIKGRNAEALGKGRALCFGRGIGRWLAIRRAIAAGIGVKTIEQPAEFFFGKAQKIEIKGVFVQGGDFCLEHRIVPARIFRDPVVGNHQRPALRFRKMRKHDDRNLGEPKLLSGENAAVAGDDHIVGADQHRVHEAELGNRARDLRNLIARMRPSVADIGDQPRNRAGLDGEHSVSVECEPGCEPANLKGGVRTRFAKLPLAKDRADAARIG